MKVFRRGGSGGGLTVPTILGNSKRYKPLFQVFLMEGDYSPVVDWEGVETELNARWLAKSLFDAVVTPFIADLKVYLKNTQLFVSALEVNGRPLPLACKKGQGFRRSAQDFATEACADGEFRPVVIKLAVWDAKIANEALKSGHTFRVTVGSVTAEAKVGRKWLERPMKRAVIKNFLKLHNRRTGLKFTLLDVVGLTIGSITGDEPEQRLDGLGEVVRTLNGPASAIMRLGGTALTLVCRGVEASSEGSAKKGLLEKSGLSPHNKSPHRAKSVDIGEFTFTREQMGAMMLDDSTDDEGVEDIGPQDQTEWMVVDRPADGIKGPL